MNKRFLVSFEDYNNDEYERIFPTKEEAEMFIKESEVYNYKIEEIRQ